MIQLDKSERRRFSQYLEQEAATTSGILDQMRNINKPKAMKLADEAMAMRIVAIWLISKEEMAL